jgi:hypothetical protein
MGRSNKSDICKNVVRTYNNIGLDEIINDQINGWKLMDSAAEVGKKKRLYGYELQKNDMIVFVVNESPYSDVCEYEDTIFSDNLQAVKEFLKDFSLDDVEIEDEDSVQQTL